MKNHFVLLIEIVVIVVLHLARDKKVLPIENRVKLQQELIRDLKKPSDELQERILDFGNN